MLICVNIIHVNQYFRNKQNQIKIQVKLLQNRPLWCYLNQVINILKTIDLNIPRQLSATSKNEIVIGL